MTEQEETRRGRPMKDAPSTGFASIGGRVPAEIKRRLDEAARRNGRTQSKELEVRLARSFKMDDQAVNDLPGLIEHIYATLAEASTRAYQSQDAEDDDSPQKKGDAR